MSNKDDRVINKEEIKIEEKVFRLELRSNGRGEFVRVSEYDRTGRRNMIIVPTVGVAGLIEALAKVIEAD